MASAITAIEKIGYQTWKFTFSGTAPYRVYLDGVLLTDNPMDGDTPDGATTDNDYFIIEHSDSQEPPAIELLDADDTGTPLTLTHPPFCTLQWRSVDYADRYRVDLYTGGSWVEQAIVIEDGRGYYQYTSDALTDCTTHQYRVVAVDASANESAPISCDILVVRNPPPPSISVSYSSGYLVTEAR